VVLSAPACSHCEEDHLRNLAAFAALFMALTACGVPALAADPCSLGEAAIDKAGGYGNAVTAAVKSAPNCRRAYRTLFACQLGSSGDNALSDIVRSKCEPLFLRKASPATGKAYRAALARCNKIAENNEGTMYQGLAAVCRAEAARNFALKYSGKR
jgi:hypothetical protein